MIQAIQRIGTLNLRKSKKKQIQNNYRTLWCILRILEKQIKLRIYISQIALRKRESLQEDSIKQSKVLRILRLENISSLFQRYLKIS
ncbi:unnamed protein product [Paramecium octaurelia]|uniref:Uncharacterized protein n=1 Tax=Paramecium octaurelia TaxID=43137 RepID=A0A8S1SK11_PAROT|nr:unnamed protein product [Paramecium octaurelia]